MLYCADFHIFRHFIWNFVYNFEHRFVFLFKMSVFLFERFNNVNFSSKGWIDIGESDSTEGLLVLAVDYGQVREWRRLKKDVWIHLSDGIQHELPVCTDRWLECFFMYFIIHIRLGRKLKALQVSEVIKAGSRLVSNVQCLALSHGPTRHLSLSQC